MQTKSYYLENDRLLFFRGLATLGVLFIHASGPVISLNNVESPFLVIPVIFLNQAFRSCVPMFFFISGYLYGHKYSEQNINYTEFLSGRYKTILLPYLFWTCLYTSVKIITNDISIANYDLKQFIIDILTGGAQGHLYFIPAVFQFYILLPVFIKFIKLIDRMRYKRELYFAMFSLFAFAYHFRMSLISEVDSIPFAETDFLIIWWIPFIILGLVIGIKKPRLNLSKKSFYVFMAGITISFVLMNYEYCSAYFGKHFYYTEAVQKLSFSIVATFLRPSAYLYASIFILLSISIPYENRLRSASLINLVGKYSFGIYLSHPFINKCLFKFVKLAGFNFYGKCSSIAVLFIAGSIITFLFVYTFQKVENSHYILGGVR